MILDIHYDVLNCNTKFVKNSEKGKIRVGRVVQPK